MEKLLERVWTRKYINDLPDTAFAGIRPGGEKDAEGKTTPRELRDLPHHRADSSIDPVHLRNANGRAPQMKDVSEEYRNQCIAHLDKHKKALGIGEFAEAQREPFKHAWKEQAEVEFTVTPEPTIDELIEAIEELVDQINARLEALEKPGKAPPELVETTKEKHGEPAQELVELRKAKVALEGELEQTKKKLKEALESMDNKYTQLKTAIKGVIPEMRIWNSWSQGPKRLIQELQRVLREF